ncbi:MAG: hypothetical protein U0K80_02150 [Methanobrevibacter sp.]|nr:hypothetical protein [Methanobrevibacter sp.]
MYLLGSCSFIFGISSFTTISDNTNENYNRYYSFIRPNESL